MLHLRILLSRNSLPHPLIPLYSLKMANLPNNANAQGGGKGKARKIKEMLFYAYPPDEKNKGYMIEHIEAVHFTDDRSMLFTIKWTLSEVLMDSLVEEEYHSQFKGLFKTKFREKEWDL